MINWILQKNISKPEILHRIKSVLNGVDEIFEEVEVIPFSNEIPPVKKLDSFKIIYGSTTFMLNAYADEAFRAGVFYDPSKFQMKHYVAKWKDHVLNADGYLIKFGQLGTLKSRAEQEWFIRPNDDGKEFGGRVAPYESLIKWMDKVCKLDLPDLNAVTEVWISEPKIIDKEWRLFVVDDEIVSISRYMKNGALDESASDAPLGMINFAKDRIREYRLHDVYVMDIAASNESYKLIECNCFNGTGFYSHNVERIIGSINRWIKEGLQVHAN